MFPHVVTVYNVSEGDAYQISLNITILRGVLLDCSKAVNARTSGLEGADSVNLYIPFSVDAVDGQSGKKKSFAQYRAYCTSSDKSGLWTLNPGDDCFFVKGEVVETALGFQGINGKYDHVYRVTKVDEKDFGGRDMQHWEVGGA